MTPYILSEVPGDHHECFGEMAFVQIYPKCSVPSNKPSGKHGCFHLSTESTKSYYHIKMFRMLNTNSNTVFDLSHARHSVRVYSYHELFGVNYLGKGRKSTKSCVIDFMHEAGKRTSERGNKRWS